MKDKVIKKPAPRLKPFPYTLQDLESTQSRPELLKLNSSDFYTTDDHPYNKRGFKYKPCRPNPFFPSRMYSTSDLPPYAARLSYFDRSMGLHISENLLSGTADAGWLSARSNVGVREGKWYIEFKVMSSTDGDSNNITNNDRTISRTSSHLHDLDTPTPGKSRSNTPEPSLNNGHVRIGFARKEASLEAPVGMDGYGYGLRDKTGQTVHLSRPADFMSSGFTAGDVIGMLIDLPSMEVQEKIRDMQIRQKVVGQPDMSQEIDSDGKESIMYHKDGYVRDQIPIKYKGKLFYEQYEYKTTNNMEHLLNPVTVFGEKAVMDTHKFKPATLPDSKITVYKNGVLMGVAFEQLYAFLPPSSERKKDKDGSASSWNINDPSGDQGQSSGETSSTRMRRKKKEKDGFHVDQDDGSLGYYPMISCYKSGCVALNPGPELTYIPDDLKKQIADGEVKLFHQRYTERVLEEYLFDILDEVESEYLDSLE